MALDRLLKLSLKLTDQETQEFSETEMDEQRKEWLQEAINAVLENDDGKKLVKYTEQLIEFCSKTEYTQTELTDIWNLFEQINMLVEGMDVAKDFNTLGGLLCCIKLLKSSNTELQWRSADLVGNCAQNNPKCQATLVENQGMETILYVLRKSDSEIVRIKCIYALSALVGNYPLAEGLFIDLKGVDILVNLLQDEHFKVKVKSAFLLRKMIYSEDVGERISKSDLVTKLLPVLQNTHDDSHEVVASMLLQSINEDKDALSECRKVKSDFVDIFRQRKLDLLKLDSEKYEDEVNIYDSILNLM